MSRFKKFRSIGSTPSLLSTLSQICKKDLGAGDEDASAGSEIAGSIIRHTSATPTKPATIFLQVLIFTIPSFFLRILSRPGLFLFVCDRQKVVDRFVHHLLHVKVEAAEIRF